MFARRFARRRSRLPAWLGACAALFAVGWGANQFTALVLVYRDELSLSAADVDAIFGVYALGLIPALLVGGPVSDRRGRRIVRPVVALSAVATVVLMTASPLGQVPLYLGRFFAGVLSGLCFAPGTAWVKELSSAGDAQGARRAAVALSAGFSVGPLVTGLSAQWLPDRMLVPYLPHLVVVALVLPLVWWVPETVHASAAAEPRPLQMPKGLRDRRFRTVVAFSAPWVFVAPAVAGVVLPATVTGKVDGLEVAFAAVSIFLSVATGIVIQPVVRNLTAAGRVHALRLGLLAVVAALALGALAARQHVPWLVLVAAVLFGIAYGALLVGGLVEVQGIAGSAELASLTAVFYALTYVGFAAPLVLAALRGVAGYPALLLAAAALAAAVLVATWPGTRAARPSTDPVS